MKRSTVKELLSATEKNAEVLLKGWVRTRRGNNQVAFIAVNDGSIIHNIQVVADLSAFPEETMKRVTTGSSISVSGLLVESMGKGQSVEIQAKNLEVLGDSDPEVYPLQKKGHSFEFLREIAHLRFRTNTFGAVFRIRHALAFAIHKFYNDKGFFYLHTPIITASDAEGAGAMFKVTTLDLDNPPKNQSGDIDFSQDFFARATNLTVSGQLEGELGALALSSIYTFGPTFRAENSNTPRHVAEFWMIEPEMAFYDINDNMDLAEEFLKYLIKYTLEHCADDLEFLNQMVDKGLLERLKFVLEKPFERRTYTEAVDILKNSGKHLSFQWTGATIFRPNTNGTWWRSISKPGDSDRLPRGIKAFYMKQNEDGKPFRAMDVLFPQIGEIIGGSQREEKLEVAKTDEGDEYS
jgi:asparaginyl-tRNA synthetase